MNKKKIKLCYAINEYNKKTDTHYKAIYELLEESIEYMDIFLILERKCSPLDISVKRYYVSKFDFIPLKFIEIFLITIYARILGYNRFYSHYTMISRLTFGIVTRISFAKSYHWHCGIMRFFWKNKINSFADFKNKLLIEWPEKLSWKLSHYLVTGNNSMKKIYHDDYDVPLKKIKILPNWVDVERFDKNNYNKKDIKNKLKITNDKKVLLFVHRIVERKGAHYIVPIMKNILKKKEESVLLVAGDGPYIDTLKKDIEDNGLENNIILLGKVPNLDLPQYFSISDLFIMPSEEEGFPRVLVESLAMGVPYVASDIGGVKEITPTFLRHNIVEVGDVKKFSHKVINELKKESLFANDYRNYVKQNFSKTGVIKKFINLF